MTHYIAKPTCNFACKQQADHIRKLERHTICSNLLQYSSDPVFLLGILIILSMCFYE